MQPGTSPTDDENQETNNGANATENTLTESVPTAEPEAPVPADEATASEAPATDAEAVSADVATPIEVKQEPAADAAVDVSPATTSPTPEVSTTSEATDTSTPAAPATPETAIGAPAATEPATAAPVVSGMADASTVPGGSAPKGKKRTKLWAAIIVVIVIILLAAGYVFAVYLPNQPANVYKSSLKNTATGIDKLTSYLEQQAGASYQSTSLSGSLKVQSSASFDASLNGQFDKNGNGQATIAADVEGQKINADIRSIKSGDNLAPDLYVRLSGIKSALDSYGLGTYDSLDGQWISIDHTLISSLSNELGQTSTDLQSSANLPSRAQIEDAIKRVNDVDKQYIFTTDPSTAVLTKQSFVGKETMDGRSVDHFKVGYNKAHLQAYVTALKNALDASSLNDWAKKANNGQSIGQLMDFQSLEDSVKTAKADYTFDLYADTGTKLVHAVKFTDPSDSSSSFTLGQNYTGGSSYPFSFAFKDKDDSGKPESGTINLSVDTQSHQYKIGMNASEAATKLQFDATFTPSSKSAKVTAPSGAKSINDIMSGLLSGYSTTPDGATTPGSGGDFFSLTQ